MDERAQVQSGVAAPSAAGQFIGSISRWLAILSVLAMLVSVNFEVIGRSFFGHATIWVTEVSTYLVVIITFIGAAFVATRDGNVRVDFVLNWFSSQRQNDIKNSLSWIATFVTLVALWKVTGLWAENLESGARSWSLLNTPLWIPQLSAVLGLAGLALALTFNAPSKFGVVGYIPAIGALLFALVVGYNPALVNLSPWQALACLGILTLTSAVLVGGRQALTIIIAVTVPVALFFVVTEDTDLSIQSIGLIAVLFFLLFSGLPVVFCLLAIGIFAMIF